MPHFSDFVKGWEGILGDNLLRWHMPGKKMPPRPADVTVGGVLGWILACVQGGRISGMGGAYHGTSKGKDVPKNAQSFV